jgi:hypothetical protein
MLKKLIKYELKATSRLLVPLYLILLFLSMINRFVFNMSNHNGVVGVINQFFLFTYVISIVIVLIVTVFYMIIRFYKNLLTDEGYLMFTLPTEPHQLITSKLIITVFWTIISIITILISLFIVFASPDILPSAINGMREAFANLSIEFGNNWVLLFTELIIMCILGLVTNILLIYLSIATGQLFSKHKIIGSFASYVIIYTVIQFLMITILAIFGVFNSKNQLGTSSLPQVIFPIVIVILTLGSACFYLATNYIFKRKLNLD